MPRKVEMGREWTVRNMDWIASINSIYIGIHVITRNTQVHVSKIYFGFSHIKWISTKKLSILCYVQSEPQTVRNTNSKSGHIPANMALIQIAENMWKSAP